MLGLWDPQDRRDARDDRHHRSDTDTRGRTVVLCERNGLSQDERAGVACGVPRACAGRRGQARPVRLDEPERRVASRASEVWGHRLAPRDVDATVATMEKLVPDMDVHGHPGVQPHPSAIVNRCRRMRRRPTTPGSGLRNSAAGAIRRHEVMGPKRRPRCTNRSLAPTTPYSVAR